MGLCHMVWDDEWELWSTQRTQSVVGGCLDTPIQEQCASLGQLCVTLEVILCGANDIVG